MGRVHLPLPSGIQSVRAARSSVWATITSARWLFVVVIVMSVLLGSWLMDCLIACLLLGVLVAVFLRAAAKAVCGGANVLHVDIAFGVQRAQQAFEGCERFGDVARLFGLGVGLVHHLDVEVKARLLQVGQRPAGDLPVGGVDKRDAHA